MAIGMVIMLEIGGNDPYPRSAGTLICRTREHSPVYRIGGDEFAVVLQGSDYQNRQALEKRIKEQVRVNLKAGKIVVAVGMAGFADGSENSANGVLSLPTVKCTRTRRR